MAERIDDIAFSFIDPHTGEYAQFVKCTNWFDNSPMDDTKADGVLYRKKDGEYFKRVLPDGRVNICWWGVKPAGLGQPTDDIYAAFHAAVQAMGYLGTLYIPAGEYSSSGSLELTSFSGVIEGAATYGRQPSTGITFIGNINGLLISRTTAFPGTTQTGWDNCLVRNIRFSGQGKSANNTPIPSNPFGAPPCGIIVSAICSIENCTISAFGGPGLVVGAFIVGENSSDCSLSSFRRLMIAGNGSHGVWTFGADANQCYFEQVDCRDNDGCGFYENSFLGNMFVACHTNANGTYPYLVGNHGNNHSVFFGCYSEGWGNGEVPGQNQTSDFQTAMVVGGIHGETPWGGQQLNWNSDNWNFAQYHGGSDSQFLFKDGKFEITAWNRPNPTYGGHFKLRLSTPPADIGTEKGTGCQVILGTAYDNNNVDPLLVFQGWNAISNEPHPGIARREIANSMMPVMRHQYGLFAKARRLDFCFAGTLADHLLNPGNPVGDFDQWNRGDVIINCNTSSATTKNIFAWRCIKDGVGRRSDSELTALGTATSGGAGLLIDDTNLTLDDVRAVIKFGDSVKLTGVSNSTGEAIYNIKLQNDVGPAIEIAGGQHSGGPALLVWERPVFEPVMMPGHFDPAFIPPPYADETAAIAGGLGIGDVFLIGTQLNVVTTS